MNSSTPTRQSLTLPSDQEASGRTLGAAEIAELGKAIESGTLTSTKGSHVAALENAFAEQCGVRHAHACSSGTAAIHCAVAAIDPEPGDEIVTTSITDMGALTPLLYQGAIPVFADVDPATYNVTAETIAAALSSKTVAIIVTHLFGNPCDMTAIMELARSKGLPVIEDCAQAFRAEAQGVRVGTIGDIGCFSTQQGKHITSGEGGIVTTNDDEMARRMFLFINKGWGYGDASPDHYFLAPNYRMNELTGAVLQAQLEKLGNVVESRVRTAQQLIQALNGVEGLQLPVIRAGDTHTFWKFCINVDATQIPGGSPGLGAALKERGIMCAPRYIQKPAFRCQIFRDQVTFGDSRWPFTLARPEAVDYDDRKFPGTLQALEHVLVLPWNEKYTDEHVAYIAETIVEAVNTLKGDVS